MLIVAARYVELNPVRARLCARPEYWPWSSAQGHLAGADDELVSVRPLLELISEWACFIGEPDATDIAHLLLAHTGTGRSLGPDAFVRSSGATPRAPSQATKARAEAIATRPSRLGPL
jgi:putative transposase